MSEQDNAPKIITLYVPMVLRLFGSIIVIVNQKVRVGPNRSEESKALLEHFFVEILMFFYFFEKS